MREEKRKQARVMVVDDEPQNVRYMLDVLKWAGYENVEGLTDPIKAVARFPEFRPDLVILDLLMPGLDGFGAMEAMQGQLAEDEYLPFLILTSDISSESRRRALSSGAKDFLTKPMSPTDVRLRVDNLLETRLLYLELASYARPASTDARRSESEPPDAAADHAEILERWGASLAAALQDSPGRSKRVAWLSGRVAEQMGLPEETVERIRQAGHLYLLGARHVAGVSPGHGKTGWGGLHADPDLGVRILAGSAIPALETARSMLASIEEHWDGSGEPGGVRGEAIPIEARIVAVARYWDEARDPSSLHPSVPQELAELEALAGSRFDPEVVMALTQVRATGN